MRLIDWTTAPKGTMTNCGELRGGLLGKIFVEQVNRHGYVVSSAVDPIGLRLATEEQQTWLVYEGVATEIPEWAECSFKGFSTGIGEHTKNYAAAIGYVAHYKLGNGNGLFKAGWTDNPDEVR